MPQYTPPINGVINFNLESYTVSTNQSFSLEDVTPTPTPSITPSVTPSITPSVTPSISITPSVTPSITPSVTLSITPSVTPSITVTPSVTPSITISITISATPNPTPTITPSPSVSIPVLQEFIIDWTKGKSQSIQITKNTKLQFKNAILGNSYFLQVKTTGTYSTIWPVEVIWNNGNSPTQTSTSTKMDLFKFIFDGTCYHGKVFGLNYTVP